MTDYMSGWEYKIANFDLPLNGEATLYYDRSIGSKESPDKMAQHLADSVKEVSENLRRVAAGESPHVVCEENRRKQFGLYRALRGDVDLSGLLGD